MLQDPIKLITTGTITGTSISRATGTEDFNVIDPGAVVGRTVRLGEVDGIPVTLTISRSETKESKPYGMKRLNLRLDGTVAASEEGAPSAQPFVQITIGQPKALVTPAILQKLASCVATLPMFGDAADGTGTAAPADGLALLTRLLNGEG